MAPSMTTKSCNEVATAKRQSPSEAESDGENGSISAYKEGTCGRKPAKRTKAPAKPKETLPDKRQLAKIIDISLLSNQSPPNPIFSVPWWKEVTQRDGFWTVLNRYAGKEVKKRLSAVFQVNERNIVTTAKARPVGTPAVVSGKTVDALAPAVETPANKATVPSRGRKGRASGNKQNTSVRLTPTAIDLTMAGHEGFRLTDKEDANTNFPTSEEASKLAPAPANTVNGQSNNSTSLDFEEDTSADLPATKAVKKSKSRYLQARTTDHDPVASAVNTQNNQDGMDVDHEQDAMSAVQAGSLGLIDLDSLPDPSPYMASAARTFRLSVPIPSETEIKEQENSKAKDQTNKEDVQRPNGMPSSEWEPKNF